MKSKQTDLETVPAKALTAAIRELNATFARMQGRTQVMEREAVGLVNDALQLGFYFQEATGREQYEFYLFQTLSPRLASGLSSHPQLIQAAVSLVNRYGRKHKFASFAEAQVELQPLLRGLNLIAAPSRAPQSPSGDANPDQWLSTAPATLWAELKKRFQDQPMQHWPVTRLDTFIFQTKPFHDDYEVAVQLRKQKEER